MTWQLASPPLFPPKPLPIRRSGTSVFVFVLLTLGPGCSTDNTQPRGTGSPARVLKAESDGEPRNSTAATQGEPNNSYVPGTEIELPADDPLEDGWPTEATSARISNQLKLITRFLDGPQRNEEELKELAASDFRCTSLRPRNLEPVYDDPTFRVRRADSSLFSNSGTRHTGASGLANALTELASSFGASKQLRAHAKLYRVSFSADLVDSRVHVQLVGSKANGNQQIETVWICQWRENSAEGVVQLVSIALDEYQSVNTNQRRPLITDCTELVLASTEVYQQQLRHGVDYWLGQVESRMGIDVGGWQGLAVGDVNGDGWDDVYVCQPGGLPNRLLVHDEHGRVRDESNSRGVDILDATHAALLVDLDNDGDQDLVVAVMEGLVLFENNGQGQFDLSGTHAFPAAIPYSLSAVDDDQDGDLDLFACCYNRREGAGNHILFARPVPYHDANNGGRNVMLRNEGSLRFRHVTHEVGLDENNRRYSYACAWEDYDNDGDQDLYVANDFGRNNLYRNDKGRFVDVAMESRVQDISPGMSACWGDMNNDGWMDLYVSNMFSSAGNRIAFQQHFHETSTLETRRQFQRHARGNSLFLNDRGKTFSNISSDAGVSLGRWAWGSKFVDVNNDGWEDILVTNGFITQEDTGDL